MEQPTTRPPIKKKTRTIFATPICTQFTFYYTSKSHVHNERSSNTSKSHAHNERSSVSQIKIHKRINKFHQNKKCKENSKLKNREIGFVSSFNIDNLTESVGEADDDQPFLSRLHTRHRRSSGSSRGASEETDGHDQALNHPRQDQIKQSRNPKAKTSKCPNKGRKLLVPGDQAARRAEARDLERRREPVVVRGAED